MSIFRGYDIRGIYGKDLTDEITSQVTKAFVNFLGVKEVVVGSDVRISSPRLKKVVLSALISQSCKAIDIGMVPTPILYYYVTKYKMSAGIMVSASHNPPEWNGLRLCGKKAIDLTYEHGIADIEKLSRKKYPSKPKGKIIKKNIIPEYIKQLLKKFRLKRILKVVIDAGNGCFSEIAPRVFKSTGCKVVKLFCKADGRFPNRLPLPTKQNLKPLSKKIRKEKADLGIAYDADGDRVVFMDEKGKLVRPDLILMLFAHNLLKKGDKLVADIFSTQALEEFIKKLGAKLIWSRTGMSYIKRKMANAKLGGEFSGHYFFKKNYNFDDGLFASLFLVELLSKKNKSLSSLIKDLPTYPFEQKKIPCADEKKFKIIKKLKTKLKDYKLVLIDGIGIKFDKGFALIRASHTEPVIRLKFEAKDKRSLKKIKQVVNKKLKEVKI
jgi:phosphomannomutase/phosphoglucomutase